MLQVSLRVDDPAQVPPFASTTIFVLFLVWLPPPHVLVQVSIVHDAHWQFTLKYKQFHESQNINFEEIEVWKKRWLPGHWFVLQLSITWKDPVHLPPGDSTTVFTLVLVRVPPPHVLVQVPVSHDPHWQSTFKDIIYLITPKILIVKKSEIIRMLYNNNRIKHELRIPLFFA